MVGVLMFAGCAEEGDPLNTTPAVTAIGEPTGPAVTAMIGPAGGTLRSANGDLELIVPAGALSADTQLSVTPLTVTAPGGLKQFRLGPEGTTFSTPATVKMFMKEREAPGAPQEGLRIAFQDSERRWPTVPNITIENRTLAVQTTHLSDWSLIVGYNLFPDFATIQPGSTIQMTPRYCGFDKKNPESYVLDCQDKGLDRFFVNWAVNGILGGNSTVGTVQGRVGSRTYTAPTKSPGSTIAVSVDWVPPPEPGVNAKIVLVSNIYLIERTPTLYQGEMNLHLKKGGPGTSILPSEYRITAPLRFEVGSSGNYNLKEGPATLVSFTKENGITNCTCSVSNVQGTVQANSNALVLGTSAVSSLQLTAVFPVTLVCTGSTDPACGSMSDVVIASWALTGQNPACMNMVDASFSEPTHVNGSWSTNCPANPQLVGRQEEASWSFTGNL